MSTVDSSKSDETVRSEGGEVNKGLRSSITSEFQNLNLDDNEKRNEFKEIAGRQHEFIKELKKDLEELTSEVERLSKEKYESELRGKSSKNRRDEFKSKDLRLRIGLKTASTLGTKRKIISETLNTQTSRVELRLIHLNQRLAVLSRRVL